MHICPGRQSSSFPVKLLKVPATAHANAISTEAMKMQHISPGDRVVVLGGSGFIGSHLIPELLSSGMSVVNVDIYEPTDPLPAEVEYVRGDIRNESALATAFAGADAVVNLAAAHHDFGIPESTFESVNIGGARAVTEAMTEAGINNLCFYSSVAVYGSAHAEIQS